MPDAPVPPASVPPSPVRSTLSTFAWVLAIVAGWIALQRIVLPAMGCKT